MSQRDFRTQAALACEAILVAARMKKAGRTDSLEKAWPVAISCVTEATLVTVANRGQPDFDMLKKLYCSEVLLPLHSLILDYPAPPVSRLTSQADLDASRLSSNINAKPSLIFILLAVVIQAYLWYGSLWAASIITSMQTPYSPASKQTAKKCERLLPRVVKLFADTTPWLNKTPRQLASKARGSIRKWCLEFLMIRCQGRKLNEEPSYVCLDNASLPLTESLDISLQDVRIAIPIIFSLRDNRLVPQHDMPSILSSTMLLHQHIGYLAADMTLSGSMRSPLVVGNSIAGVSFSDLVRHFRDTARSLGTIAHMRPPQCYQIEVQQLITLANVVLVAGSDFVIPCSPALIDAFASNQILTYTASLFKDPRADLVRDLTPEENVLPLHTDGWEELVFPTWGRLVNSAYLGGNNKVAAELVDSRFLFLLERWSLKRQPQDLYGM